MQTLSFRCGKCHHRCDIHNINHSFSDIFVTNVNLSSFARVSCPAPGCQANLYHCRQCIYNSVLKADFHRHVRLRHPISPDDGPPAGGPLASDSDNNDDFNQSSDWNNDHEMDDISRGDDKNSMDNRSVHSEDDNMDVDEEEEDDGLEDLHPFEGEPDSIIADLEDIEQDEFLRDLVSSQTDEEEESALPTFDYGQFNPHNLLTLEAFGLFGDNIKSKIYYWQNDVHRKLSKGKVLLGGFMSIVWCAIQHNFCFGIDDVVSLHDSTLMFNMLDHALANKGEQQQNFFDILSNVFDRIPISISTFIDGLDQDKRDQFEKFSKSLSPDQLKTFNKLCDVESKPDTIKVPHTKKEANALLLKGEYAMLTRLPSPKVYTEDEGHAYVSVCDVVDHAMADGLPINWLQDSNGNVNSDTINGSQVSKDLLEETRSQLSDPDNTAIGTFVLWSDGFCRTFVKQKDNSCWILTLTFLNPDGKSKSPIHTYCIVIGKSSANHTPVFETVMKELEGLRQVRIRYCGITGKFIKTSFSVVVYASDRIERCSLLHISQIGTFGQRSHWAFGIDPTTFPMCNKCFQTLMSTLQTSPFPQLEVLNQVGNICQDCSQFDPNNAMTVLLDRYPTTSSDEQNCPDPPANRSVDEAYHMPMMQSFEWLRQGLLYAHFNCTQNNTQARWRNYNLKPYLRSMAISSGLIDKVWASAQQKNKYPNLDVLPYMPYLFTIGHLLPMERFINSPMHLLFHGVITDVMALIHKYMKDRKLLKKFESFVNKYLLEIESFRLGWCKLRKLPKAFWLAEDILGFSRIMPCIYGLFFANNFKLGTQTKHTKIHKSIQQLLNSLHVLVSTLMNPRTSTDIKKIKAYIRVYLSCGHQASKLINGKGETFWMDKGNHLSLENLPEQIARHGPIRWYWEGVSEAYIQEVKPYLVQNMRKTASYFRDKLTFIYKRKAMAFIKLRTKGKEEEGLTGTKNQREGKGFYCYSSLETIQQCFQQGLPLSGFVFKEDYVPSDQRLVLIAFGRSGVDIQVVPIQYTVAPEADELCGMVYANCTLSSNGLKYDMQALRSRISSYCLMLPYVTDCADRTPTPFSCSFAMVYDDWDVLSRNGKKDEIMLSRTTFNE